jgi:hypothetical protein
VPLDQALLEVQRLDLVWVTIVSIVSTQPLPDASAYAELTWKYERTRTQRFRLPTEHLGLRIPEEIGPDAAAHASTGSMRSVAIGLPAYWRR